MTSYTNSLMEYFLFIYCCSYNMRTSRLPIPLMLSKSAFNFINSKGLDPFRFSLHLHSCMDIRVNRLLVKIRCSELIPPYFSTLHQEALSTGPTPTRFSHGRGVEGGSV